MPTDLELLAGIWKIQALEIDGTPQGPAAFHGATVSLIGDRFTTNNMGAEYSGRIELNPDLQPKLLAMHFETGPEAGTVNYGIYEIVGDGWRFCLNMSGRPAPSEFRTTPGSGCALEILVRDNGVPAEEAIEAVAGEAVPELEGDWAMLSCVRGGEPLPPELVRNGIRRIRGANFTLHFGEQLFMEGYVTKDAGGDNAIRLVHNGGSAQGTAQLGIYSCNGDILKTCFGAPGAGRPGRYTSTKSGGETYATWERRR